MLAGSHSRGGATGRRRVRPAACAGEEALRTLAPHVFPPQPPIAAGLVRSGGAALSSNPTRLGELCGDRGRPVSQSVPAADLQPVPDVCRVVPVSLSRDAA